MPGETIAIKVNFNNTYDVYDADNDIDQSPQATRVLIQQLTNAISYSSPDVELGNELPKQVVDKSENQQWN